MSVKLTDQGYLLYLSKYLAPCLHTAVKPMWRDMLKDALGVKDSHVSIASLFSTVLIVELSFYKLKLNRLNCDLQSANHHQSDSYSFVSGL